MLETTVVPALAFIYVVIFFDALFKGSSFSSSSKGSFQGRLVFLIVALYSYARDFTVTFGFFDVLFFRPIQVGLGVVDALLNNFLNLSIKANPWGFLALMFGASFVYNFVRYWFRFGVLNENLSRMFGVAAIMLYFSKLGSLLSPMSFIHNVLKFLPQAVVYPVDFMSVLLRFTDETPAGLFGRLVSRYAWANYVFLLLLLVLVLVLFAAYSRYVLGSVAAHLGFMSPEDYNRAAEESNNEAERSGFKRVANRIFMYSLNNAGFFLANAFLFFFIFYMFVGITFGEYSSFARLSGSVAKFTVYFFMLMGVAILFEAIFYVVSVWLFYNLRAAFASRAGNRSAEGTARDLLSEIYGGEG